MEFAKTPISREPLYPAYDLRFNPFLAEVEILQEDSEHAGYRNIIFNREAKKVVAAAVDWVANDESSKLWLVKDMGVNMDNYIYLSGAILRQFMHQEELKIFPTIVLLPLVYHALNEGIEKFITDRLTKDKYRLCLYAHVFRALSDLVEKGIATEALPDVDVEAFLAEIEETDGTILDEVLYPEAEDEEAPEEAAEEASAGEEASDAEEASAGEEASDAEEAGEGAEEELSEEVLRAQRLNEAVHKAIHIMLEESSLGLLGKEAIRRGLITIDEGHRFITAGGRSIESLNDVLSFMTAYYRAVFVLVDRVDAWNSLEDEEHKRIYAETGEWRWVIGDKGCLALSAGERFGEAVDKSFLADAIKVQVHLGELNRDPSQKLSTAEAVDMTAAFLASARSAEATSPIGPFTEEAVATLLERADGEPVAFLQSMGEVLERSAEKGLEIIEPGAF